MAYTENIYSSIFGESPATVQARRERNASFQDMLNSRKQAAEQARTDNVRMARYNAFGNLLTSMVQPLGWGIGGGFSSSITGGVQQYDNRQYLDAFNRAVKAADDLRNIGSAESEFRFKLADEDYRRQQAIDDEARQRRYKAEEDDRRYRQQMELLGQRNENALEQIAARGDVQMAIQQFKQNYRASKGGRRATDSDLKKAETAYYRYLEKYRTNVGQGVGRTESGGPLSFAEFLTTQEGGGYSVSRGSGSSSGGSSGRASGASGAEDFSGYRRGSASGGSGASGSTGAEDFSQYKRSK